MSTLLGVKAVILDLDGVITNTRIFHFEAWKKAFDAFLMSKGHSEFTSHDYEAYVDGKPRLKGISDFMISRNISLSNNELDSLGLEKNRLYLKLIESKPLNAFEDAIKSLREWKSNDLSLAVVSSSENCRPILKKLGLNEMFDVCVDGVDGKKLKLKGKPEPDYFFEALKQLKLMPEDCILVEDAVTGVVAAKKAHFKKVYGISRIGQTSEGDLYAAGSDGVINSLCEIGNPPNVLTNWDKFLTRVGARDIALFIDFDGTLSEIVPNPSDATLSKSATDILKKLSRAFKVSIVSGRDRLDVKEKVGIENLFYAGCHGLDMSGPGCFHYLVNEFKKYLPDLEQASLTIGHALVGFPGVLLERKQFATAVHYRMAADEYENSIREIVFSRLASFPKLKSKEGKKVIEILPNIEWGKGRAVQKLCEILDIDPLGEVPIYIGDDKTDEDAFIELSGKGIGIKVDDITETDTVADFVLRNPQEVTEFLLLLLETYSGKEKKWRPGH